MTTNARRPWTLLVVLGGCLLVAAAAAAIFEGYAADAQSRVGDATFALTLAVVAVLVTFVGVVGRARSSRRTVRR